MAIFCILGSKFRGMEKVSPILRASFTGTQQKRILDEAGEEENSKKWEWGNALEFSDVSCSVVPSWDAISGQEGIFSSLRVFFMLYNLEQLWPSLQKNWDFFFFFLGTEIAWCFNAHFVYMRSFHFLSISLGTEHSSQVPLFYYTGNFPFFDWEVEDFFKG